jgi:Protein of unknown function (DUF3489)
MRGSTAERINTMTDTEAASTTQSAAVAEQGAHVAPEKAFSKKDATQKKNAAKGRKSAKKDQAKAAAKKAAPKAKKAKKQPAAKKTATPAPAGEAREGSKKDLVLGLLRRKDGATMAEIAEATGWQNHTIRGFMSGNVGKRMGLAVQSSKNASGARTYKVAK